MTKVTLDHIGSTSPAAIFTINSNMDKIETAIENTLSRDGSAPNQMQADFDMNHNDILNVKDISVDKLYLDGKEIIPTEVVTTNALLRNNNLSDLQDVAQSRKNIVVSTFVSTRTELKALNTSKDTVAYLTEAGREGIWVWRVGNYSTQAVNDPEEGVIVVSNGTPSSGGAWVRTEVNKKFHTSWFGAKGDNSTDDLNAINKAITYAFELGGGEVRLDPGEYKLGPGGIQLNFAEYITSDVHQSIEQVTFRGDSVGNTGLRVTNSDFAVTILGANDPKCLIYGPFGGFSVAKHDSYAGVSQGLRLFDVAFATFDNITLIGMNNAVYQTSCLSNTWNRLHCTIGNIGVLIDDGSGIGGFSDHNANKYNDAEFRSQATWAVSGGPSSGIWFQNLTVQGCGTQGNSGSGGLNLSFRGTQGGVGLVIDAGYFEYQGGFADINLVNTGTETIVHTIRGVNFSRVSAAKFVTHNIVLQGGPQILNLEGCHFDHFNDYVPNASRNYVQFVSGTHKVICRGCFFGSTVEQGSLRNEEDKTYGGFFLDTGVGTVPPGWSTSRIVAGQYRVTHNLNLAPNTYAVNANLNSANLGSIKQVFKTNNTFDIFTESGGAAADRDVGFTLRII